MFGCRPSKAPPHVQYVASHRVCGIRIARHRVWQDYREQNDCTPVAANVGFPSKQRRENLWHAAAVAGKLRRPTKQPLNLLNYWSILPRPLSSDTLHCVNTVTLAILIWSIRCKHANYFRNILPLSYNIVNSNIQNLSSNIMHSRGQKPVLYSILSIY